MPSSIFSAGGVSQIIAGTGVTITPTNGKGVVTINSSGGGVGGVTSFNTRTGAVTLSSGDVTTALTYTPANVVSPAFSGTPTSPTPVFGDNSTKVATTAFVQNAVTSAVTGVVSFNTRTGAVTLAGTDVTTALGYTPANVIGPSFTGVPTAPTATLGTNTTQLATTAFVQAAVVASTTGVSSFKSYAGGTPRTGAVTLANTDIASALHSTASTTNIIWNTGGGSGGVDAGVSKNLYFQRHANYTETDPSDAYGVTGLMYLQSFTPAVPHKSYEWGITSEMFSYSVVHPDPINGIGPQNVAVNGTIWKRGSAPVWAGNFNAQNQFASLEYDIAGSNTVACEIDVGGFGVDSNKTTIGVHLAANVASTYAWSASTPYIQGQLTGPTYRVWTSSTAVPTNAMSLTATGNGYVYKATVGGTSGSSDPTWPTTVGATVSDGSITWQCVGLDARGHYFVSTGSAGTSGTVQPVWPTTIGATVVDGSVTWTNKAPGVSLYSGSVVSGGWQYGHRVLSDGGTSASFYSEAVAPYGFGLQLAGSYAVGIDTTTATNSSGIAFRMKAGDAICFDGTSAYKMKLNAGAGLLEFYNGSTRHGYINIGSGADVNFNSAGGGGGVTSFNGNTGAITLSSGDVTSALGFTPASNTNVVDLSSAQGVGGTKTFSSQVILSSGARFDGNAAFNSGITAHWNSGGGNVAFGTGKTNAFYLRIMVDGSPYYLQVLNP